MRIFRTSQARNAAGRPGIALARWRLVAAVGIALGAVAAGTATAQDDGDRIARGKELAASLCAGCHATAAEGESPLPAAPPFRNLGERYPVADLEESLAEGIVTGHEAMPEVALPPDDVAAFIAYLESLAPPDGRTPTR